MANEENIESKHEVMGSGAETEKAAELTVLDSVKINDSLTINFYEGGIVGLDHFHFTEEVLLKKDSMKKVVDIFTLHEKEQDLNKTLKGAGFKR